MQIHWKKRILVLHNRKIYDQNFSQGHANALAKSDTGQT